MGSKFSMRHVAQTIENQTQTWPILLDNIADVMLDLIVELEERERKELHFS